MNKLPFVLSFLLFPAVAWASDAEYNANKSAWDAVNLSPAYEAGLSGKDVRVAIVDNGFWATHQEFTDKMTLSGERRQNHGTAVASIIGAAQNDLGMQGVAYNASLLAFPAEDIKSEDNSACGNCQEISSIFFNTLASDGYKDVKIINASWGVNADDLNDEQKQAYLALAGKVSNKLLVAAAGNEMAVNPLLPALVPFYDKTLKNVINVVAFDASQDKGSSSFLASFTNLAGDAANWTISAPGVGIYAATGGDTNNAYKEIDGTSAAAPIVSGAAALVQEKFPFLTGKQIGDILLTTANNDFSGFSAYAEQHLTGSDGSTTYRIVYFEENKAGENEAPVTQDEVISRLGLNCNKEKTSCTKDGKTYAFTTITYAQAFGAGILDVGKALNGLGALDGSRMDSAVYTLDIPADYDVVFSNDIDQRNTTEELGFEKTGKGTLTLSGKNAYKGDTSVSAGTLKLTGALEGGAKTGGTGTLIIDGAAIGGAVNVAAGTTASINDGSVAGAWSNSGETKIAGGTLSGEVDNAGVLTMTGGALTGGLKNQADFVMKGGSLSASASETASLSNAGTFDYYAGTLSGTVQNADTAVFNNHGTLESAAVSGGVLNNKEGATVGSSFSVKTFANEGNIALLTDENGDLLKMTVEQATLTKGRFTAASSASAVYNDEKTYTVLEASSSLTIEPDFEDTVRLIGLVNGKMVKNGNTLNMTISYLNMNDPDNMPELDAKELSVAKAIDKMFKTDGNKEFSGYYYQSGTELKKTINTVRDQIQAVRNQSLPLSGAVANNVYSHLFQIRSQREVVPALRNQTPQYRYRGHYYRGRSGGDDVSTAKIWAQALGGHARFGASDKTNRGTMKSDTVGGQFGFDWQSSDDFLIGLTAGFAHTRSTQDSDRMIVQDYRAGVYAGTRAGRVNMDAVVLGGVQRYEGRRRTDIEGLSAVSKSSYNGYTVEGGVNLSVETGRMPRRDHTFGIRPYVSANVAYTHQDAYKEKGDTAAINLAVSDANDTSVSVQPGLQFSYMWADAVLTLDAGWQRLLTGGNPTTKAYFISDAARTSFESLADDADKDYLSVSVGLESNLSRRTRLKLWADQKRSKNNVISTLSAALQYAF